MKGPPITVRCDCGEGEAKLAYGERWTCPSCERAYDTTRIPEQQYREVEGIVRRYRIIGWVLGAILAGLVLLLVLQHQPLMILAVLPAILLIWFTYGRPILRSRYRKAIASAPRWELRAEGGPRQER